MKPRWFSWSQKQTWGRLSPRQSPKLNIPIFSLARCAETSSSTGPEPPWRSAAPDSWAGESWRWDTPEPGWVEFLNFDIDTFGKPLLEYRTKRVLIFLRSSRSPNYYIPRPERYRCKNQGPLLVNVNVCSPSPDFQLCAPEYPLLLHQNLQVIIMWIINGQPSSDLNRRIHRITSCGENLRDFYFDKPRGIYIFFILNIQSSDGVLI